VHSLVLGLLRIVLVKPFELKAPTGDIQATVNRAGVPDRFMATFTKRKLPTKALPEHLALKPKADTLRQQSVGLGVATWAGRIPAENHANSRHGLHLKKS